MESKHLLPEGYPIFGDKADLLSASCIAVFTIVRQKDFVRIP